MWQYSTSLHLLSVHMYQVRAKCFPHNTCIFLSLILNSGPQIPNGYSASQFLRHLLRCFPLSHSLQWWFHTWVFSNPNPSPVFLLSWWPWLYFTETIEAIRWKQTPATKSPNLTAFVPVLFALPACYPGWASLFSSFALSRMLLL